MRDAVSHPCRIIGTPALRAQADLSLTQRGVVCYIIDTLSHLYDRECLIAETCACSRLRRSLSLFCDRARSARSQNKISFWCGEAA